MAAPVMSLDVLPASFGDCLLLTCHTPSRPWRLLVDTGHVADWGGDPLELLEFADHVQLRQGAPGRTQLHVDDPDGVVDFRAVLRRVDDLNYAGAVSVEHFDLPDQGWPLADPRGWALDLAAHVRALS